MASSATAEAFFYLIFEDRHGHPAHRQLQRRGGQLGAGAAGAQPGAGVTLLVALSAAWCRSICGRRGGLPVRRRQCGPLAGGEPRGSGSASGAAHGGLLLVGPPTSEAINRARIAFPATGGEAGADKNVLPVGLLLTSGACPGSGFGAANLQPCWCWRCGGDASGVRCPRRHDRQSGSTCPYTTKAAWPPVVGLFIRPTGLGFEGPDKDGGVDPASFRLTFRCVVGAKWRDWSNRTSPTMPPPRAALTQLHIDRDVWQNMLMEPWP